MTIEVIKLSNSNKIKRIWGTQLGLISWRTNAKADQRGITTTYKYELMRSSLDDRLFD